MGGYRLQVVQHRVMLRKLHEKHRYWQRQANYTAASYVDQIKRPNPPLAVIIPVACSL
jgi:hypothetical protein